MLRTESASSCNVLKGQTASARRAERRPLPLRTRIQPPKGPPDIAPERPIYRQSLRLGMTKNSVSNVPSERLHQKYNKETRNS